MLNGLDRERKALRLKVNKPEKEVELMPKGSPEFHMQVDRLANFLSPRGRRGDDSERRIRASS